MTPQPEPSPQSAAARDLVVALTPFEEPNPRITAAAERAGALGLLDLGRDPGAARAAFAELGRRLGAGRGDGGPRYGVRVPAGCPLGPGEPPPEVDTVLLADPADHTPERVAAWAAGGTRRVWAETVSPQEARAAVAAGAVAVVAKGHEAAGRVGPATTFVLLQQLLAGPGLGVPVLAYGGIGPHTAAAAVAGGAAGVLVDVQLALTNEGMADLPGEVAAALRAMDGSETRLADGHRVFARPDLPLPEGPVAALLGARDLRAQLLPVGQDGASAARLAARHRTTGGVLQAVRAAVTGHLEAAVRARPLLRARPVAQGPMTRVSDQAAFAEAVAAEDGVPYLALAVMEGPDVRRLLAETAERLGDRPWGVGLLGFAPPELRREQLAAVAEVRPPYAIIAGGTPAQAAPLEAAGIATHLHVPSPGLLERYLAEGARRFVFEGLECGGHVGPRASFPLWEEQIELLLTCPEPAALDVLFAGGIHDARSAAMAVAAAAPLAERGARIGVLMGTAYLFTEEAVAAGAVLPVFQRAAVECADTVLLHTAPGHSTRCAATPYAETFETTRRRLAEDGTDPRTAWEELERLNLGRLRIASKGLRRGARADDSGLEAVGEEEQYAEGLFMLGQAATLRSATTTIAALHAEVTTRASEVLRRRAADFTAPDDAAAAAAGPLDIAIVGMACAYPGAPDLAAYWAAVLAGKDAVTEVPAERWDPALYYDADPARAGERTPSRWGGFLDPVPFDALAHGIPPASLAGIEPVQLLALEISARALADAGYGKERAFDRSRTSVVFGAEAGTELAGAYGLRALHPAYLGELPPELDDQLPRLTEDSFPGVLANVIAGRVANRLDLGGANCTVDAACASSLAALDLACRQLRDGDSDMVLCGGADVHNGINDYLMFASVRALSPTGHCRPFDAAADGIALGEGVGALVLKRLADAERDGDRVYAVVKAVGSASDGRSLGLTAPRPEGQRRALDRAYARAGIAPGEVGLVEAHGTGTVVGDSTELAVLNDLFTSAGAAPGSCALGSVKSQLGHTKCAAGLAGLIKAARAVHAGVRPPTLHIDAPNPAWDADRSPFFFDTRARPWAVPVERRIAGVSAFGFGGTNYHAVLAGYPGAAEPAHGHEEWPAELFCFRGEDRRAAGRAMARLAARLEENDTAGRPWALRDLAAEVSGAGGGIRADGSRAVVRVAVVAGDLDELAERLERARAFTAGPGVHVREEGADPGRVAFLFPGQGSQRVGMLAELYTAFPTLREQLDDAPEAVVSAVFPPAAFTAQARAEQRAAVTDTRVAQPALGLAGVAAYRLLAGLGVRPDCVAGHSYGELVALWAAGVYGTADLLRLSGRRAGAILAAAGDDPGAMAAVAAAPEEVRELVERAGCVVANHNAPRQCVISGPTAAVSAAVDALRGAGLSAELLSVACAFHSPVVAGAAADLTTELAGTALAAATVPVWSNTTAGPYPADPEAVRDLVARQVASPVRFVEQVEAMYAAGVRTFVEAGPGRVLSGLVGRILGGLPHTVVPLDVPGEPGLRRLVTALAELAAAGVAVDPEALFRGRSAPLPARAPRRPGWLVDGHLVRTADGTPVPGGLRPARRVAATAALAAAVAPVAALGAALAPAVASAPGTAPVGAPALAVGLAPVGATVPDAALAPVAAFAPAVASAPGPVPVEAPARVEASAPVGATVPGTASAPVVALAPVVAAAAGTAPVGAPAVALVPVGAAAPGSASAPASDRREEVLLAYLRGTRELVAAQRDVMLGYLGAAARALTSATVPMYAAPATEAASGGVQPGGAPAVGVQPFGTAPVAAQTGWAAPVGAGPVGATPDGAPTLGAQTLGIQTLGATPLGAQTFGGAPVGAQTGGVQTGGVQTGGAVAGGAVAGGAQTFGAAPVSAQTGGVQTGVAVGSGAQTGGVQTVGAQTGGFQTGGFQTSGLQTGALQTGGAVGGGAQTVGAVAGGAARVGVRTGGAEAVAQVPGPMSAEGVMDVVLEIVHTRTGYPRDMLDPELDLEADLSIDSIKRVEIIGALADRIGLPRDAGGSAESAVEELSRIKTLRGIVDWITSRTATPDASAPVQEQTTDSGIPGPTAGTPGRLTPDHVGAPDPTAAAPGRTAQAHVRAADPSAATPGWMAPVQDQTPNPTAGTPGWAAPAHVQAGGPPAPGPTAGTPGRTAPAPAPVPVARLRVDLVPVEAAVGNPAGLGGLRVGVVEDGQGLARALAAALREHGAEPHLLARPEPGYQALVDLSALRTGPAPAGSGNEPEPVLPDAFGGLQRALTGGVGRLLLVTAPGSAGAGLHGFARSAAIEFPGTLVRAVGVHPKEAPEQVAAQLLAELAGTPDGPASVGYTAEGQRVCRRAVPAPLAGADLAAPPLDPGSVVLLTGGARGITARSALALARATGCHVELIGRTPEPPAAADEFGQALDRVALRAALIGAGLRTPAEIEAAASRILAEREVRASLAALAEVAASVRYHCADVTDEQAVRAVVADVRARHGRLDGIVHGAGTLRDGLLADKQPAAFAEVFTTKVAGARHLAAAAAEHGATPAPRFLVLFGSVAGVYGNRGQTDYAAANDALDTLALTWADTFPGRVLSVDWGPWAAEAGGMVTPELERAYARRGVPLITPEAGTAAFLAELAHGSDVQVVLMAREDGGRGDE
ncbi:SDR family NAD(P)-dependent oxidoreductase [Streptomyces sp. NPDC059564]|uniref:SDR family NAD(P)-dependent oxidoreductase n=1 Tax=Streptomyces sp. NPDC059564 TaxID=3346865 RepID=UPI0036BE4E20